MTQANGSSITNSDLEDQPQDVSIWYFRCSAAVWLVTPLLFMSVMLCNDAFPYTLKRPKELCHPVVFYPLKFALSFLFSVIWVYVIIPTIDIWYGFKSLLNHSIDQSKRDLVPGFKLFENFGEAIPQFLIAAIFQSLHYSQLPRLDQHFFWVSMSLSLGSILYGIGNGFASRGRCMTWLRSRPEDHDNELA